MALRFGTVLTFVACCALTAAASADDLVKDAAIGGAIGGALGGAVGAEVGGKEGAVIGAGVGGAAGAAIATQNDDDHRADRSATEPRVVVVPAPQQGRFCPPGQAKKGRC